MATYNTYSFKQSMKEAFELSEKGVVVFIERKGSVFQLLKKTDRAEREGMFQTEHGCGCLKKGGVVLCTEHGRA